MRSSNHLTDILGMLEIFPAEKMNAYTIRNDIDKSHQVALTGTLDHVQPVMKTIQHLFIFLRINYGIRGSF